MSLSTTSPRMDYIGDGGTSVYAYNFKVFSASDLVVIKRNLVGAELPPLTLTADFTVSGVGNQTGGNVTLIAGALPAGFRLIILRVMPLKQQTDIRNQSEYYPATLEDTFDKSRMMDQQLQEQIARSLRLSVSDPVSGFSPVLPPIAEDESLRILRVNLAGNGFEFVDADTALTDASGGATGLLKDPTDLVYGGSQGNPAKVATGDTYEDAFDKVATLLSKMVPTPPDNLSAKILKITGSYSALAATSGDSHTTVTDSTTPEISPGLTSTLANGFSDADSGSLSGEIDATNVGTRPLTAGSDIGTNSQLSILDDFDPYLGQGFGKEGIFKAITAKIQSLTLALGLHTTQMKHTKTGNTALLSFYIDDPVTPSVGTVTKTLTTSGASSYRSGVPGIASGEILLATFNVANAIKSHYNAVRIASANSPQTNSVNAALPGTPPAPSASFSAAINLIVAVGAYSEDVTANLLGYNSKGTSAATTVTGGIRVDTVGIETRLTSGTGQYPASGYGSTLSSTTLLSTNKELQYLNGVYRYPVLFNYSTKTPSGPDYSALTTDSYASMRWATFSLGSISAASAITFAFSSFANFGGTAIVSGLALYIRVDGGTPTTGWIDANTAYPGVGNPTANGDAALDVGSSTATSKRVTFGSAPKTGTVYVRVGIPSGSTKVFGGVA